ncbi:MULTISPECIES: flagellar hook-length control protein FliK [unclassified Brenneria]|uniref:flagellar hook-length control protein FliK n=1 Tax=unclassified Brenneria TaxID=2634434 RepID=UPI0020A67DC3|nr:flagellar hook-length control protein FliK [Brenneria sp. hezel4-2-4]MEE3649702.1 flagellar hook-length control protein FliK [Brenneria sp. HEZEL_4_2_4]
MNLSTVTMITTNDNQRVDQNVVNSGIPDFSAPEQSFDRVLASTLNNSQKTAVKEEKTSDKNQADSAEPQGAEVAQASGSAEQALTEVAAENVSFHKSKKSTQDENVDAASADVALSFVAAGMQSESKIALPTADGSTAVAVGQSPATADEATQLLVSMIQASQTPASTSVPAASVAAEGTEQAATAAILAPVTQAKASATAVDNSAFLAEDNAPDTLPSATTASQSKSSLSGRSLSEHNEAIADVKSRTQALQQETSLRAGSDAASFTSAGQHDAQPAGNQSLSTATVAVQQPVSVSAQAPAIQTSASIAPTITAQINAQLGSDEWQQAVSQQVIMFTRNGQQNAELRLHPQELGALQISLKLDDNQAHLHLVSANSQVRAAMEAALPHLRTSMAESGINLGQASVGSDASPGWQQQEQQQFQSGSAEQSLLNEGIGAQTVVQTASVADVAALSGRVDIFA